ncbi:MAG: ribbon-helix-helix domain-containing protein [Fimbriiglobus sp.]
MKTFTITLPDPLAAFVEQAVAEQRFTDPQHVVVYAVAQLAYPRPVSEPEDIEWVRAQIQVGLDQIERGEVIDGEVVMARLRAKLAAAAEAVS